MKIIDGVAHIMRPTGDADSFNSSVMENIRAMQDTGLEVEVQYRQSDICVSALILGRKDKEEPK